MPAQRPRGTQTSVVLSSLMMPADANFMGNIHGGVIMKLIDEAAGTCAFQFCRTRVGTAAIDRIDFLRPVQIGNLVTLKANVNFTGTKSMEVGVRVEAEDLTTGVITHCASAYVVFVALGDNGVPIDVPHLKPRTVRQKQWFDAARRRREKRLGERARAD